MKPGAYSLGGIRLGMSEADVRGVKGAPTECGVESWLYRSVEAPMAQLVVRFQQHLVVYVSGFRHDLARDGTAVVGSHGPEAAIYEALGHDPVETEHLLFRRDDTVIHFVADEGMGFIITLARPDFWSRLER